MRKLVYIFLALLMVGLSVDDSYAQKRKPSKKKKKGSARRKMSAYSSSRKFPKIYKYVTVGGTMGYVNYFGDLAPTTSRISTEFHANTPNFGGFITKRLNNVLTLRGSFGWVRLFQDDNDVEPTTVSGAARYNRNLHFRNNMLEASGNIMFDLLPTGKGAQRRPQLNPYLTIGLGFITSNPQALGPKGTQFADNWYDLRDVKTGGQGLPGNPDVASVLQMIIPFGIGARYRVTDNIDLGLELTYRYAFTSTLDDVSADYASWKDLAGNDLAVMLSNRSAEPVAAYTGNKRFFYPVYTPPGGSVTVFPGQDLSDPNVRANLATAYISKNPTDPSRNVPLLVNGQPFRYLVGYERGSSPRGSKSTSRDGYFVTSFQLYYILTNARVGPRRF